jgi:hypothetical protein
MQSRNAAPGFHTHTHTHTRTYIKTDIHTYSMQSRNAAPAFHTHTYIHAYTQTDIHTYSMQSRNAAPAAAQVGCRWHSSETWIRLVVAVRHGLD